MKRSRNKVTDDEVQDAASVLMDLSWHTEPIIETKEFWLVGCLWDEVYVATLKATVYDL